MKLFALFLVVLVVPGAALAQVTTQTYDIRDLTLPVPDYPLRHLLYGSADNMRYYGEGGGGASGGLFGGGGRTVEVPKEAKPDPTATDDIIKLISTTVAPETWRDAGGTVGTISHLNGFLIVTTTAENHKAIDTLLATLKDQTRRPIRMQAHWVLLTPDQLAAIKPAAGKEAIAVVPDDTLKNAKVYSRGQVTAFIGQVNHIASTVERNYLTDLTPVVGSGAWAFDPDISRISSGVALQFKAVPSGKDEVTLDLISEVQETPEAPNQQINVSHLFGMTTATTRPVDGTSYLDRPRIVCQTTKTTVRIPLGQNVLIGGATLEPGAKDVATRELYLVLRADTDKK